MYSIVCDARKGEGLGISTLAMVDIHRSKKGFWTSDQPHLIKVFTTKEAAERVKARLKHNNPKVLPAYQVQACILHQAKTIKEQMNIRDHEAAMNNMELGWDAHKS